MNKRLIQMIILTCLLILLAACSPQTPTGQVVEEVPADTQAQGSTPDVVMLGLKNGRYTPEPINMQQGKEVILKNDGSLVGCALNAIAPDLGIKANFMTQKEYRFTPQKKGTFDIMCSMSMYRGTIIVS